jgi:hypothetical protein
LRSIKSLSTGIKEAWTEEIYEDVPPPEISQSTDPRYCYSLVKGLAFNRRLGHLASFLFDKKIVTLETDARYILDVSIITEELKTRETGRQEQRPTLLLCHQVLY